MGLLNVIKFFIKSKNTKDLEILEVYLKTHRKILVFANNKISLLNKGLNVDYSMDNIVNEKIAIQSYLDAGLLKIIYDDYFSHLIIRIFLKDKYIVGEDVNSLKIYLETSIKLTEESKEKLLINLNPKKDYSRGLKLLKFIFAIIFLIAMWILLFLI